MTQTKSNPETWGQTVARKLKRAGAWIAASIATTALASIFSTQFVLAGLTRQGISIPFGDRLAMTGADLAGLGPLYVIFLAIGLLIAFLAAGLVFKTVKVKRRIIYIVAGAVAVGVTLTLMQKVFFGVELIAGSRTPFGFVMQMLSGAVGGFIFDRFTRIHNG